MELIISGRRMEVTKAFNQYVRKRFKKWAAFLSPNAAVHVIVSVEGYRHLVEVTVKDGPYAATGKQTTKDMYQSVDLLSEKIGHQLMRKHGKLTQVKSASLRTSKAAAGPKMETPVDKGPVIDVINPTSKPMTHEEAALQLQSLRKAYIVFEDADTGQLAVMEKLKDGTFKATVKE